MLYFTEHPEGVRSLVRPGTHWTPGELSGSDAALWSVFAPSAKSVCHCATVDADNRTAFLIDTAMASQFDAAMAALKAGIDLPDRLTALALAGTRFRGQRERPWTALRGNLHYTAHYRLDTPVAHVETGLTLLPVVAAARAIDIASGGRARPMIKWVNDVFIDDAKVGGVLTATQVTGSVVERAVFGIGINVAYAPEITPTPFVPRATSLAAYEVSLPDLFTALMHEMDRGVALLREAGSAPLFEVYREYVGFIGRDVTIWPEDPPSGDALQHPLAQGRVLDLLPDLSLVIAGCPDPVRKGRMALY